MDCLQCKKRETCGCYESGKLVNKDASTAELKDKLTGTLIGLARLAKGMEEQLHEFTSRLLVKGLFATLTSVNFDNEALMDLIEKIDLEKQKLLKKKEEVSICVKEYDYNMVQLWDDHTDIRSLKSMILQGIRGIAVYAYHAAALGYQDHEIHSFLLKALRVVGKENWGMEQLFPVVLETGKMNLKCMEMADRASKETFGRMEKNDADRIIDEHVKEALKNGEVRHLFLVAGCDKTRPGRNYYTEFIEKTPEDSMVLTMTCDQYQPDHSKYGQIGMIPRVLDVGRCNDSYFAIRIAKELAEATGKNITELPLSMVLSWYEQRAVCILLTLMYLKIKNIRLGPSLPTYISQNVLDFLYEKYNIALITTPEEDLKMMLG